MAKNEKVDQLMLSREDIEAAIREAEYVKKKYPAFWKFYEMLIEMNNGLAILQESMEGNDGRKRKR
jgi:hypothetical protein